MAGVLMTGNDQIGTRGKLLVFELSELSPWESDIAKFKFDTPTAIPAADVVELLKSCARQYSAEIV